MSDRRSLSPRCRRTAERLTTHLDAASGDGFAFTLTMRLAAALALLAVLAISGYCLFHNITIAGMSGVDTFSYWESAKDILAHQGAPDSDRLWFDVLNALALKMLGINDYAIHAFVGTAQLLNIVLVFLLALRVRYNLLLALLAAALYAFNPAVAAYARTGLPHIYGASFVLLVAHCGVSAVSEVAPRPRLLAAAGAGFFIAGAALTHEDLILVAPGLCLGIMALLNADPRSSAVNLRQSASAGGAFILGFTAGLTLPMVLTGIGPTTMLNNVLGQRADSVANMLVRTGGNFLRLGAPRILHDLRSNLIMSPLLDIAEPVLLLLPICYGFVRLERLKVLILFESIVASYLILFILGARVYLEGGYTRIFVPLFSLVLIATLCGAFELAQLAFSRLAAGRWADTSAMALCAIGSVLSFIAYLPLTDRSALPSTPRQLYDAARTLVSPDQRLLIPACFAPSDYYGIDAERVGVGSHVYLGDLAVQVFFARDLVPFDRFVKQHSVGYVFIPNHFQRAMTSREDLDQIFTRLYGVEVPAQVSDSLTVPPQNIWPGDKRLFWSDTACTFEAQLVREKIFEKHGRLVSEVGDIGKIYSLQ